MPSSVPPILPGSRWVSRDKRDAGREVVVDGVSKAGTVSYRRWWKALNNPVFHSDAKVFRKAYKPVQ